MNTGTGHNISWSQGIRPFVITSGPNCTDLGLLFASCFCRMLNPKYGYVQLVVS